MQTWLKIAAMRMRINKVFEWCTLYIFQDIPILNYLDKYCTFLINFFLVHVFHMPVDLRISNEQVMQAQFYTVAY